MSEELSSESPLAIMGDEDTVEGFKALGFRTFVPRGSVGWAALVEEVVHSKAVICLVQDEVYQQARLALDSYKNLPFPIFIPFSKTMSPHQKFGGGDLLDIMIKGIRLKATGAW